MDNIAGTGFEQERQADTHPPALLVIVLDTNPLSWDELSSHLRLDRFIAELLVFINAHLACNHANRIAVLASHCTSTAWLYPSSEHDADTAEDTEPPPDPNKYRPFAIIEQTLRRNLRKLYDHTTPEDIEATEGAHLASSLTVAIGHISRLSQPSTTSASTTSNPTTLANAAVHTEAHSPVQNARILLASTSGNLASQYIPLMNLIFAAQHLRVPLDILKLAGDTVLLQQASYTTNGIFLSPFEVPSENGEGTAISNGKATPTPLLPLLLFALLPDPATRRHLVPPTAINVDFRAACFCHRRVVDIGYVCSICLSIFCDEGVSTYMTGRMQDGAGGGGEAMNTEGSRGELPKGLGACLTCGTALSLKVLGGEYAEDKPRKKKKKRRREGEVGEDETGTPVPG